MDNSSPWQESKRLASTSEKSKSYIVYLSSIMICLLLAAGYVPLCLSLLTACSVVVGVMEIIYFNIYLRYFLSCLHGH